MLTAIPVELFATKVTGVTRLIAYRLKVKDGVREGEVILSMSQILQRKHLKALNRNYFLISILKDGQVLFTNPKVPDFNKKLKVTLMESLTATERLNIQNQIREVKPDVTNYDIFREYQPSFLNETTEPQKQQPEEIKHAQKPEPKPEPMPEPKPEPKPEPMPEPKPEPMIQADIETQNKVQETGKIIIDSYGIDNVPNFEGSLNHQPTLKTIAIGTAYESLKADADYLTIETLTEDEKEKARVDFLQGKKANYNFGKLLDKLGIQVITDRQVFKNYLVSVIKGTVKDDDPRVYLPLNMFTHFKLLHSDAYEYSKDKLIKKYLQKRRATRSIESFLKFKKDIEEAYEFFDIKDGVAFYESGMRNLISNGVSVDAFDLTIKALTYYPVEGLNLGGHTKGELFTLPSAEVDKSYVMLPKTGKLDFNEYQLPMHAKMNMIKEESKDLGTHLVLYYNKKKVQSNFTIKNSENKVSLTVSLKGTIDLEVAGEKTSYEMFQLKSDIDSSINIPFPDHNNKLRGLDVKDYVKYRQLQHKLTNNITVTGRGDKGASDEYKLYRKLQIPANDVFEFFSEGKTAKMVDELIIEMLEDGIIEDADFNPMEMEEITAAEPVKKRPMNDLVAIMAGLKTGKSPSNHIYRARQQRAMLSNTLLISELLYFSIIHGFATFEEIEEEINNAPEEYSFKTGITYKANPPFDFLGKALTEIENYFTHRKKHYYCSRAKIEEIIVDLQGNHVAALINNYVNQEAEEYGKLTKQMQRELINEQGKVIMTLPSIRKAIYEGLISLDEGAVYWNRVVGSSAPEVRLIDILSEVGKEPYSITKTCMQSRYGIFNYLNKFRESIIDYQRQSKEKPGKAVYVQPETPFELLFGFPPEEFEDDFIYKEEDKPEQEEQVKEEPVKEEPVKEPVQEEPVKEEPVQEESVKEPVQEPVQEPVKEEPVKGESVKEPVQEPVKEEPVKEPVQEEPVKEEPEVQNEEEYVQNCGAAKNATVVRLLSTAINVNSEKGIIYGAVLAINLKGDSTILVKETLPLIYADVVDKRYNLTNAKVSLTDIQITREVEVVRFIDTVMKRDKTIKTIERKTDPPFKIKAYESLLARIISEYRKSGKLDKIPTPAQLMIQPKKALIENKLEGLQEELVKHVKETAQVKREFEEHIASITDKPNPIALLIGQDKNILYFMGTDINERKIVQESRENLISADKRFLTKVGIHAYGENHFIATKLDGSYVLLDSRLNEIG